ncbi:hypothetical protein ACVLD2_001974 [Paenibacillus sp. PvR052]|nr:hypothetical protein [Paenibacillus sp. PvP091]MBP1172139.1 hypothetical protein [Paenibacillus sp. PvR098]MBP2438520.1 hypothetical protein [Paenibacillus sp. PvP052]
MNRYCTGTRSIQINPINLITFLGAKQLLVRVRSLFYDHATI